MWQARESAADAGLLPAGRARAAWNKAAFEGKTVQEALAEWRAALGRAGARYAVAMTDEPFGRPLRQLVGSNGRGAMI